ncbi:hypothetical protein, partial [Streptomyces turgidiscabies]|uniref:hypothetical protein n=1 Tax=Streptomyces turgidiscabies TaxID=85558 RepID=UPI0038F7FE65
MSRLFLFASFGRALGTAALNHRAGRRTPAHRSAARHRTRHAFRFGLEGVVHGAYEQRGLHLHRLGAFLRRGRCALAAGRRTAALAP